MMLLINAFGFNEILLIDAFTRTSVGVSLHFLVLYVDDVMIASSDLGLLRGNQGLSFSKL